METFDPELETMIRRAAQPFFKQATGRTREDPHFRPGDWETDRTALAECVRGGHGRVDG